MIHDPTQRARILNVNADAATREMMGNTLRVADYAVVEASDGTSGLALARERPDLIILDVRLPDIGGLEVCRRLKADPLTAHIPVLQTSATFVSPERKVEGLDSGADAYLAQPIDEIELLAMVRAMLRTRRAEEAERLAGLKWQRTFDVMSDGVLVLDSQGVVVNCNRAMGQILEVNPERAAGNSLDSVLGLRVGRELMSAWPTNPQGPRWETEVELQDRWYRLVADAAPGKENRGLTVLVLSDISERKKLEEGYRRTAYELAFAARRKDEFLAMLAHELRNPLNAIVAANALQDTFGPPDEESVRLRSVVARQTRHLARMIDDLLDVSRVTRGEIQMRKEVLELGTIIGRVCESQRAMLDARGQRVVLSLPDEAVSVEGDELRLEQVISNLLANASKYSDAGSEVRLSLAIGGKDDSSAVLTLSDSGIGIPPDMLEDVFDMFVQVDRSLARTLGGLGLGLTVVKHVVQLHGGTVYAKSAGIGKGATFVVTLPRHETPAAKRESDTHPVQSPRSPGLDILLVEDNDDTRDLVAALLETRGHRVQCAADGLAGVNMAIESKPDVALIDIGLPEMSGYEVAQRVRENAGSGAPFMVAVTGYGSPDDLARATQAGFDAHIVKPIDSKALFNLLAQAGAARAAGAATSAGKAS